MLGVGAILALLSQEGPPQPGLVVQGDRCLRRFKQSHCEACIQVCPIEALSLERGPLVNTDKCANCGACSAACPTAALALDNVDWKKVVSQSSGREKLVLACINNPEKVGSSPLPCLGCLSVAALLAISRQGEREVALFTGSCTSCKLGKVLSKLTCTVERVNALLGLFDGTKKVACADSANGQSIRPDGKRALSRRQLFGLFGAGAGREAEVDVEGPADGIDLNTGGTAEGSERVLLHQKWLLLSLTRLASKRTPRNRFATLPVAGVLIDDRCQPCHLCTMACPTKALTTREDERKCSIQFEPAKCVECGLCAEICPCNAVLLSRGTSQADYLLEKSLTLVERTKGRCSRCGGYFLLRPGEEICEVCGREVELEKSFLRPVLVKNL